MQTGTKKFNGKGWYLVFINAIMGCAIAASYSQFSMVVGQLSDYTGLSQEFLMTTDTIKSFTVVIAMMISGAVYKRLGLKWTFVFCLAAYIIPQLVMPINHSAAVLVAMKILQGLATISFPVFLLTIMSAMDASQTGTATAVFNGIFYAGGGIGGTIAGYVIAATNNWAASFYVVAGLALVVGIVWLLTVKAPEEKEIPADTPAPEPQQTQKKNNFILNPLTYLLVLSFFATTWVTQTVGMDIPLYAADLGYDTLSSGKLMNAITIGILLACLVSGRVSDFMANRSQNRARARLGVLMVGPIGIIVSVVAMNLADLTNFGVFFALTFLLTFFGAWGLGVFYSILPEMFRPDEVSSVTGIAGGLADLGMPIGPTVVGVIFGAGGRWDLGWYSCGAIALVGILCNLALMARNKKRLKTGV